jgi:hypothetical protein
VTERSSSLVVSAANHPVASAIGGLKGSVVAEYKNATLRKKISVAVVKDQNLRTSIPNDLLLKPIFNKERAKNKSQLLGEMRPSSTFSPIVKPQRIRVSTDRGLLLEGMDGDAKCSYECDPPYSWGDDVNRLLRFIENGNDASPEFYYSTIDTSSSMSSSGSLIMESQILNNAENGCAVTTTTTPGKAIHCSPNLTPGHIHFLGTNNCEDNKALEFKCAPIDSQRRLADTIIQKGSSAIELRMLPAVDERRDLPKDDTAVCASKSLECQHFDATNRSHIAQYYETSVVLLAKDICSSPDLK